MKQIINQATRHIMSSIAGLIILLIGSIYQDLIPTFYPEVVQKLPKEVLLKITTLAILLAFLSSVLSLIFYSKLKTKFTPLYGVYWDKKGNAYCRKNSCRSLLCPDVISGFSCPDCGHIELRDLDGKGISISDALKKLRS